MRAVNLTELSGPAHFFFSAIFVFCLTSMKHISATTMTEAPTTIGAVIDSSITTCPPTFTEETSGCFYVEIDSDTFGKTWQEAEDFCQTFGGNVHLAVTDTYAVRKQILSCSEIVAKLQHFI